MSVLTDFATVLSSGGITTPIFKGTMPSTPDDLIGLFETGGPPPIHAMSSQPGMALAEQPHVQLVVRDTRPDDAKKTAQDCFRLLDGRGGIQEPYLAQSVGTLPLLPRWFRSHVG